MTSASTNRFPTWMIVVSIIILAFPIIWALSIFMDIIAAMSIGGILVVVALVALFIWLKGRVDDER
ncbi:MAG: hypothetical protein U9N79_01970 [Actinomycetota bacterium]|nr:hypothetical protein [Actinomycetota bacterium]